ncbi:MAG: hypothetical protein NT075_33685 [Chloroflexi bacterium]|nr:hypothetical protein [Chloroflexota bacterium]
MGCIRPPAVPDEQLLALIDGAATDDVVAHVEQCGACRDRANHLARQQGQLAVQLYRVACPSPLDLGEYHLGLLSTERIPAIAEHLATCAPCEQELQRLQGYLLALAPTLATAPAPAAPIRESAAERLQVFVATLVDTLSGAVTGGGRTPALAGLRGGEPEEQWVYAVGDLQIIIAMPPEPKSVRKGLFGLILGLETDEKAEVNVELQRHQSDTTVMTEGHNFVFEHVTPGVYTLILRSPGQAIRIENLTV